MITELNEKETALVALVLAVTAALFTGDDATLNDLLNILTSQIDELGPLYERFDTIVDSPEVDQILSSFKLASSALALPMES